MHDSGDSVSSNWANDEGAVPITHSPSIGLTLRVGMRYGLLANFKVFHRISSFPRHTRSTDQHQTAVFYTPGSAADYESLAQRPLPLTDVFGDPGCLLERPPDRGMQSRRRLSLRT